MLSVQNKLPIKNYSQLIISDNPAATYKPDTNSRIRVRIPASSVPMIDPAGSYLKFDLQVKPPATVTAGNKFVMELGNRQGAEQVVRDLRVYLDNKPIEEITHYNVLDKVQKDYGQEMAERNFRSTFDHAVLKGDNPGYFVREYDASAGTLTYNSIPTKQQFTPSCSGVLSMSTAIPLIATGDLAVEVMLADHADVLTPKAKTGVGLTTNELGKILAKQTNAGGNVDAVDGNGALASISFTVAGQNEGWSTVADCPFFPGNIVEFSGVDSVTGPGAAFKYYLKINGNPTETGGIIKVPIDAPDGTFGNGAVLSDGKVRALFNVASAADKNTATPSVDSYTYEVTKVEYVCRTIQAPPVYLQSLQQRVRSEGFSMDIPTNVGYLQNILSGIGQQSLLTPNYASRVKGFLQIPLKSTQVPYFFDRQGQLEDIRNYQFKIGSRVVPQRPVDMTNTTGNSAVSFLSQEHIQELHKSLNAMGIGLKTLLPVNDNFVVGRTLSINGSSEDLADKGIRTEIEYRGTGPTQNLNVFTYVHLVRRVMVSAAGLEVFS